MILIEHGDTWFKKEGRFGTSLVRINMVLFNK